MSEKNLRSFVEKLVLVEKEITSSSRRRCDDAFVLSEFWRDFKAAASRLSREATKLSLAFGKPPLPRDEECKRLVADIDAAVSVIISCFHRLPSDQGRTLLEVVTVAVQKIVTRVRLLFVSLEKGEKVTSTGLVWDACDLLEDLPRDNKQAVLRHLETIAGLVKDALSELEEAQTSQGVLSDFDMDIDDDAQVTEWTEEEKKLVAPCSGLVKGCGSLLKKLRASLIKKSAQENGDLDSLVGILRCLNERVDCLVSGIYAPIDVPATTQNARQLAGMMEQIISTFSGGSLHSPADKEWTDFLTMAIKHNLSKMMFTEKN